MCIATSLAVTAKPKTDDTTDKDKKTDRKEVSTHHRQSPHRHGEAQCQCCAPVRKQPVRNRYAVVDLQLLKKMGIDSTKISEIRSLKQRKNEEMAAMRKAAAEARRVGGKAKAEADKVKEKAGTKVKEQKEKATAKAQEHNDRRKQLTERMKEERKQMQDFMKEYRAELRRMLGDDKYIEYLEKKSQQPEPRNAPQRHARPAKRDMVG